MAKKTERLEELIIGYLEHLEVERNTSKLTIRNYHHYLSRFFAWYRNFVGSDDITKLNLKIVKRYRMYLSRYIARKGRNLSVVTQAYHVIALRSFLKWLVKNDVEVLSPEKIDLPRGESKSLKFLNQGQMERLMGAPVISDEVGLRDRAILELLYSTGLRVSELVKTDRDKIDFETREFGIIGKGGRARVVFLSDRAADWLGRYFKTREDSWKPAFVRYSKKRAPEASKGEQMRLTARSVQRIVEKYRRKAKLPVAITPHGLRHTFATDLLSHGAGLREVQEMLGHKNIATTQIYTHVTNPQLKKVHEMYHSGNKSRRNG